MTQIWSLLSDRFMEYISRNVLVKSWVKVMHLDLTRPRPRGLNADAAYSEPAVQPAAQRSADRS